MEPTGNPHGAAGEPQDPGILAVRCSACNTLYRVSPEQIPEGGRRVKCSRCGHVWFHGAHPAPVLPHPDSWAPAEQPEFGVGGREPSIHGPAEAASTEASGQDEEVGRNGLTAMLWLIGILAVLVLILGVHVFAPRISAAIPALAPVLSSYAEVVGAVLAWVAETVTSVGTGLRDSFQSYTS